MRLFGFFQNISEFCRFLEFLSQSTQLHNTNTILVRKEWHNKSNNKKLKKKSDINVKTSLKKADENVQRFKRCSG